MSKSDLVDKNVGKSYKDVVDSHFGDKETDLNSPDYIDNHHLGKFVKAVLPYRGHGVRVQLFCDPSESRTHQSFKDECDIHNIMKKFHRTSLLDHINSGQPFFGDFSDVVDYQSALNMVIKTQDDFNKLPSEIRSRFMNDPQLFIDFINDESNHSEMVDMGLISADSSMKLDKISPRIEEKLDQNTSPQEKPTSSST